MATGRIDCLWSQRHARTAQGYVQEVLVLPVAAKERRQDAARPIAVFPAVTEEIAFRGLVQHWLHVAVAPWTAIALASALFAAMHFSIVSAPYLFLVGGVLGWARWRTGSLYPSMVAHFVHNLAVLAYFPQ